MSLYKRVTKDLIVDRPLDASTFFTSTKTNIGEIQGRGVEIDLNAGILEVQTMDFDGMQI